MEMGWLSVIYNIAVIILCDTKAKSHDFAISSTSYNKKNIYYNHIHMLILFKYEYKRSKS